MEESDALSDRIMIITNGAIKADGTSAKLKEQYGSGLNSSFVWMSHILKSAACLGYKLVINKQITYPSAKIENELRQYLPQVTKESDQAGEGDVVFRTNQQPDNRLVQALRHLDMMKNNNRIKTYGVQNSTMDDVFLKITREAQSSNRSGSSSFDIDRIGESQ